jgi:hypothetical protein
MAVTQLRWRSSPKKKEWSNQETAEFYRIAHIMEQAGLVVEMESGVSDEGDPWLVFVRPDTGDVIAHFAKFDNRFLSVSALNQEVFEGADVRTVVDRMLDRHPFMVPRPSKGSKLFLHPGVVLSAFVAAAYFMVVDSARAGTIEKILSDTLSGREQNKAQGVFIENNETNYYFIDRALLERSSNLRTNIEDSSNFSQMAILGAVLRLKEIFSDDGDRGATESSLIDDEKSPNASFYDGQTGNGGVGIFDLFLRWDVENNYDLMSKSTPMMQIFSEEANESLNHRSEIDKTHWTELFESHLTWGGQKPKLIEISASKSFEESFDYQSSTLIDEFGLLLGPKNDVTKETSSRVEAWNLSDPFNVQALVNNAKETFNLLLVDGADDEGGPIEGIGVAVGTDGEVAAVGLKTKTLLEPVELSGIIVVEQGQESSSTVDLVTAGVAQQAPEEQLSSVVIQGVDPAGLNKEILVHQVRTEGVAELTLTDSADIILYWGGDLVVEGFEFGQDLFWFFLSHEKIEPNSGQVIDGADLQISFGVGNTLTFVDVLGASGAVEIG